MKIYRSVLSFLLSVMIICPAMLSAQHALPQRIISLAPSLTESLCILGMEDKIAGVTSFCTIPASINSKPKVASAVDVNIEKALMLKPDLVVTTKLTDIKDVRKLQAMGLRVEIFEQPRNFEMIHSQFIRLGQLTGTEEQAKMIMEDVSHRVDSLTQTVKGTHNLKAVIQIGANPLFVATEESLMNDMLKKAGYINIAEHWGSGLASREKVLALNPDKVFIVTMGVAGQQEKKNWSAYKMLKAAQNNSIYVLDAVLFCSPTPEGFARAVAVLIDKLKSDTQE